MREPPKIINAKIVFRPCTSVDVGVAGKRLNVVTIADYLEERYPGWKEEMMKFMQDQIGMDVLLALPPSEFAAFGMIFALIKERKI